MASRLLVDVLQLNAALRDTAELLPKADAELKTFMGTAAGDPKRAPVIFAPSAPQNPFGSAGVSGAAPGAVPSPGADRRPQMLAAAATLLAGAGPDGAAALAGAMSSNGGGGSAAAGLMSGGGGGGGGGHSRTAVDPGVRAFFAAYAALINEVKGLRNDVKAGGTAMRAGGLA